MLSWYDTKALIAHKKQTIAVFLFCNQRTTKDSLRSDAETEKTFRSLKTGSTCVTIGWSEALEQKVQT